MSTGMPASMAQQALAAHNAISDLYWLMGSKEVRSAHWNCQRELVHLLAGKIEIE